MVLRIKKYYSVRECCLLVLNLVSSTLPLPCILYTSTDAYNDQMFKKTFLNKFLKFDLLVDNGRYKS